jgi:hypothetical protein
MPCGDEPKRVWLWFLGLLFRECNLLFLFSNASKQTKPVCFFSKDRSGVSGKADIEGGFVVGRGNVKVLFRPKRHTGMALEQFGVTHVRPSGGPRRSKQTLLEKLSSHVGPRSHKRPGASILCPAQWDTSRGAAALATVLTYSLHVPVTEREVATGMLRMMEPLKVKHRGGFSLLDMKHFVEMRGLRWLS